MPSIRKVTFPSRGIKVVGELRVPDDASAKKRAAVIVAHPMSGVKEQTAGSYAELLAKEGFYTLAYDAAYQGESEGEPHFLEDPIQRAGDNNAAADYLSTLDEVDPERIGILGICASGGYVSFAAQSDPRLKAVATLSGADTGSLFRDGMPEGSTSRDQLKEQLKAVAEQRIAEARGEKPATNNLLPVDYKDLPKDTLWHDGAEYYLTPRGQHPRSCNTVVSRSLQLLVTYDSYRFNELISPRPYLAVAGEKADTLYFSQKAIELAKEPKELYVVPGESHVSLYDHIDAAGKKFVEFFTQHIAQ
ncbi:uncharacterized protein MJAP1_004100 [Malassezia japonica]|uniref:Dienelactone hydrolase domain-containing protein n=1 Tax=Malassezia japonica TaxID=223818 RepID=A0AAF0F1I7_9BASI|nr:uncharacterized protein MJAP1_004100 [Malassezia japonica]WFD41106.1 hypothetical protein MJAP1_004100 [Malassezia japonica]